MTFKRARFLLLSLFIVLNALVASSAALSQNRIGGAGTVSPTQITAQVMPFGPQ
jgi:hypothetical protein